MTVLSIKSPTMEVNGVEIFHQIGCKNMLKIPWVT